MAKGYVKSKKVYAKKAYSRKGVGKLSVSRNFLPFPSSMKVSIPFTQSSNYAIAANQYGQFGIAPMSPFQLEGFGPGMLADVMRFYQIGTVVSATVSTTFTSREQGGAESLNIVAAPCAGRDLLRGPNNLNFSALQSSNRAQCRFMSSASGGHDVVTFTHFIQVQTPLTSSFTSSVISSYNAAGQLFVGAPAPAALEESPVILYMYTPVQPALCDFQVTRRVTFNFVFSRPHYPRAPFIPAAPQVEDDFQEMEQESCRSSQTPINRQVTQGMKRMNLNRFS